MKPPSNSADKQNIFRTFLIRISTPDMSVNHYRKCLRVDRAAMGR